MTTTKQYPPEVLEIHNEFDTAGEKLLVEAKEIIASASTRLVEKGFKPNLLKKLGFIQTPEVVEYTEIEDKMKMSKRVADIIHQYAIKYPTKKFITEEQVKQICQKWNLVYGSIERFTGFVPEKNLKELAAFHSKFINKDSFFLNNILVEGYDIKLDSDTHTYHLYKKGDTKKRFLQSTNGTEFYGTIDDAKTLKYHGELCERLKVHESIHTKGFVSGIMLNKSVFTICAPIKDMDTKGMRVINNRLTHYPDPVILYPVEYGYIIVTAWGDEASDPMVMNPMDN